MPLGQRFLVTRPVAPWVLATLAVMVLIPQGTTQGEKAMVALAAVALLARCLWQDISRTGL